MQMMTERQLVEIFHLLFLTQLGRKVDKGAYILKGGCNLRFFFRSPRYSEDIDLDTGGIPVHKLEDAVTGILKSKPFEDILRARGIRIVHVNSDKQTETTQRWKLNLTVPRVERPIPTKIEYSRRGIDESHKFDAVDTLLTSAYGMPAVMTHHYLADAAFRQKIGALADRKETQARDIFDMDVLLNAGAGSAGLPPGTRNKIRIAKENVLLIDYGVFKSQVVAYLPPEEQKIFDPEGWDALRMRVYEALDKVAE